MMSEGSIEGVDMSTLTKRSTVYLEPELHKALRLQSIETSRSMSELINDAIRDELAEDAADLAQFEERKKEPAVDFETFVKRLQQNGTL
jgi:hypothetical protein